MTAGLLLMKSVLAPLAKSILLLLELSPRMSAADTAIHKKIYGSRTTALIILNEDIMEDIMKIVKLLEESGLLVKGINETITNETKGKKGGFIRTLLGTLAASLLGSVLTRKRVIRAGQEF